MTFAAGDLTGPPLAARVALVAGATRGAGRALAVELSRAGAVVYATGRSSRVSGPSEIGRRETIEETGDLIGAAGGTGSAVVVDHEDPAAVRDLVARIGRETGRLDILVNDIFGGDRYAQWDKPLWEHDLDGGLRMLRMGIDTHLITAHAALPLMLQCPPHDAAGGALLIEVTDGTDEFNAAVRPGVGLFYDLVKAAVSRVVAGLAHELADQPVTALGVTPGWLRSEQMLEGFGVTEATWRDTLDRVPGFAISESPTYLARGVAALAGDPGHRRFAGRVLTSRPGRRLWPYRRRRIPTRLLGLHRAARDRRAVGRRRRGVPMTSSVARTTDALARVLEMAQSALEDPAASAADLASRAHLSRFHFDRLVSAAGGEPAGAMRRRLLLERAAHQLLRHPSRSVLDVAIEAGYGSHEAFTPSFARHHGRTPSALRADPPLTLRELWIPAPSGVHFQPPGGLRLPARHQETEMSMLQQLVDHHVDSLTALIDPAADQSDEVLDRPITSSIEGIDDEPSLRGLLNTMVTQEEHGLSAARGGGWPDESDTLVAGLRARQAVAGRDYRSFVAGVITDGALGDTVVDTTCDPPITHSIGGIIGHVVTFGAVRRTTAVGALWTAGHQDFSLADPRPALDAGVTPP